MRSSAASISVCGKPFRPIASINSLRSGFDSANAKNSSSLIAAKRGRNARLNVGMRTAAAGISSMKRINARLCALDRIGRCEALRFWRDLIEILNDDRRVDQDCSIVLKGRHHAVRVEREVVGLKLIAGQQIELH